MRRHCCWGCLTEGFEALMQFPVREKFIFVYFTGESMQLQRYNREEFATAKPFYSWAVRRSGMYGA